MKKILLIIFMLVFISCSKDDEDGIKDYEYFLNFDTFQFRGNLNAKDIIYQYGIDAFQIASSSWIPNGNPKDPNRILLFALNSNEGNNQFFIETPNFDSTTPTELDQIFAPGIKKLGPGTDSFKVQIINNDSTFRLCDLDSDYKLEVLKTIEIFDLDIEGSKRQFKVWFKIEKVLSDNCSSDTNFELKNALIIGRFIQF